MSYLVEIDYTNHRGERAKRVVAPIGIRFAATEYHPEAQWIMDAHDLGKVATRSFATKDIHAWRPITKEEGEEIEFYHASPDEKLEDDIVDDFISGKLREAREDPKALASIAMNIPQDRYSAGSTAARIALIVALRFGFAEAEQFVKNLEHHEH